MHDLYGPNRILRGLLCPRARCQATGRETAAVPDQTAGDAGPRDGNLGPRPFLDGGSRSLLDDPHPLRHSREVRNRAGYPIPSPSRGEGKGEGDPLPLLPGTELGASACAEAHALAPILLSPFPLKALRACPESLEGERGTKGVRVPFPAGKGISKNPPHFPICHSLLGGWRMVSCPLSLDGRGLG